MTNYLQNKNLKPFFTALLLCFLGATSLFSQTVPTGAISGIFSVSNTKKVYFSKGNLQYIGSASTPYWKFADNQWGYLGTTTSQNSTYSNKDRDLFGWGTSGYNHGATCYQPWSTSTNSLDYEAYNNYSYGLFDGTGKADWGYNAISNGGNTENSGWRTLTDDEWYYVFTGRTTSTGIRYAKATVNGVSGVILLPDDWSTSYYSLSNTNTPGAAFTSNSITSSNWTSKLENHGAVFLPAGGLRTGSTVSETGTSGYYWSATGDEAEDSDDNTIYVAYYVSFTSSSVSYPRRLRSNGYSVRLVKNAPTSIVTPTCNPRVGGKVTGDATSSNSATILTGTTCTLTASANSNYIFVNWTVNNEVVSTNATYSFTTSGDVNPVANFTYTGANITQGVLNGEFTVSNGQKVKFSQGNLQYIGSASTPYWKFAEKQWDYLGTTTNQNSSVQSVDRDLFGWGTSGQNHGAIAYQPWSTSQTSSDYNAYGNYKFHLYDETGMAEWGYNAISNGGNTQNCGWRTLTKEEWVYLLITRSTTSGVRYAKAKVNNINGIILLPDNWSTSYYSLNSPNTSGANYSTNTITSAQWNTLEQHGAVFLPAAGYRNGSTLNYTNSRGYYQSESQNSSSQCFNMDFSETGLSSYDYTYRYWGLAVRLVRPSVIFYEINANPNPSVGGSVSGAGSCQAGTNCTLTATANTGYAFVNWTLNGVEVSTNATYSFTVSGDKDLVANFTYSGNNIQGALNSAFSVSSSQKVYFSQGNLQYKASTNKWRFAEKQYDYVSAAHNANISSTYSDWIDLFGWATSGHYHNSYYQPYSTNTTSTGYGPTSASDITGTYANHDWGVYNAITNGGNTTGLWRTMTQTEWSYLLNTRSTSSGIRYAKATVNGVYGVILLPDNWSTSYYSLSNTNNSSASYSSNIISASNWSKMEQCGAVFLPAGGYRDNKTVSSSGSGGYYWTASSGTSRDYAYHLYFFGNNLGFVSTAERAGGHSVRLVRNHQSGMIGIKAYSNPVGGGEIYGTGVYQSGSQCTLSAVASEGYTFTKWTNSNGTQVSTNANYTFTVSSEATYVAVFTKKSYSISASASPSSYGSVSGTGTYSHGTNCTLTATANTGYIFVNWTENGQEVSQNASYSFTVTGPRTLVAHFFYSGSGNPTGTINGSFSVSANQQVLFSKGNLQYIGNATTPYWKFADNQWDCLGTTTNQNGASSSVNRDLFGWGTSGYNHGAVCYQPWSTSQTASDYYAYGSYKFNLYDYTRQADWGYQKISNGGNQTNSGWRTLTYEEWRYLFETRSTTSGIRFAKASINNVNGVILLPDNWNASYYQLNNTNSSSADYSSNVITSSQWHTLELYGAVFLPAAGYRFGTSVNDVGSMGRYWSATVSSGEQNSLRDLQFTNSSIITLFSTRSIGYSVRLVRCTPDCPLGINIHTLVDPEEGGTASGDGSYNSGATATLTAVPSFGYSFVNWTENGVEVSTNATYTFTVTQPRIVKANFVQSGCLNSAFSINENGAKVAFSQGNLQYQASTKKWRFAETQWSTIASANQNISSSYTGWIDLFGWGTSGYHDSSDSWNTKYYPYSSATTANTYTTYNYYGYGPSINMTSLDLTDSSRNYDWGVYNKITNGGNTANIWRVLSQAEWDYLFNGRNTPSGVRFVKATVATYWGVILLPDDWSSSYYTFNNVNDGTVDYSSNTLTSTQWKPLEQHGAVFLPVGGYRTGTTVYGITYSGNYWSSSYISSSNAHSLEFDGSSLSTNNQYRGLRYYGYSVRLVKVIQNSMFSINVTSSPGTGGVTTGGGSYEEGTTCTLTATPNTGYHFVNWTEGGNEVSTNATYSFTVTGNKTLVANFSPNTYTVTLNTNGGTINSGNVTSYTYGVGATLPTNVTRTGYTFGGWYDNSSLTGTAVTSISTTATGNKTFWAKWTANTYTVTLNTNGGTINSGNVTSYTYGVGATLPTNVTRTGYTFGGWYDNSSLTGTAVTSISTTATGNKTFWAKWNINSYTLTINYKYADGTTAAPTHTENVNYNATYSVTSPEITGYTPDRPVVSGKMGTANVTVNVTYAINSYTLTVNYKYANGTTAATTHTESVNYNATYSVTSPEITGYTPDQATVTGTMGTANVTVNVTYAINSYTLTVNYKYANGTTAATTHTESVNYNATYSITSPEITGYTPDLATVTGTMGTADVTVDVTYTINSYTLTVNYKYANGTTAATTHTESVNYNATYSVTSPEITGYTPDQATVTGTMVTADVTVNVTYTINSYEITATANPTTGGTVSGANTYDYGTTATLTATASTGYHFVNWTEGGSQVSTNASYSFTVTGARTLVANFEEDAFRFINNGNWNTASNWQKGALPSSDDIVIINANCNLNQNATVTTLTVTSGYSLTIKTGYSLNVTGTLTNTTAANLIIEDGAQLITSSSNVAATVKKTIDDWNTTNWYFISSPIGNAAPSSVTGMITDTYTGNDDSQCTYDLYSLDITEELAWLNYRQHNFSLTKGMGYLYASKEGATLNFTGNIQPSNTNVTVSGLNAGFNLVGNPFTCDAYLNQNYYMLVDGNTISASATGPGSSIAPCLGVIIDGTSVTFSKTKQTDGSANNGNLELTLTQAVTNTRGEKSVQTLDNAIVSFNEGSELGKFYFGTQNANIYIPKNGKEYAIVSVEAQGEMPVCFKAAKDGQYTITVNTEEVEMGYLHLIDNIAGTDIDLIANPSYTFNAKGDDYESRFRLVFSANSENEIGNDDFAFISNDQLIITGEGTLEVIDVMGRILVTKRLSTTNSQLPITNFRAGVYVLRLINGENVKTQKIVVK